MDEYKQANLNLWNEYAALHPQTEFYDLASFRAGGSSLKDLERSELGDVSGKSLLHLQCHFGMDTLSWARLGANVTGADFSDKAIATARALSQELNLPARFVQSDIFDLPNVLHDQFDIVFTSYGVLIWLPDLKPWARVVAHFLKPGGTFYIAEIHPFAMVFDNDKTLPDFKVKYPYFHTLEPLKFEVEGSYADTSVPIQQPVDYEWVHSMGDILNALLEAGLRLEYLHEWPFGEHQMMSETVMRKDPDGLYRLISHPDSIPLTFSIKATKPE